MQWHTLFHVWHEVSKHWRDLAPLAVSIVLAFITWLQWRTAKKQWKAAEKQTEVADKQAQTARNQLRLTLFERRIVVRDALLTMVGTITTKADLTDEQLKACARGTKDAEFLFPDKTIDDYCRLLLDKAVEFQMQKHLMSLPHDPESEEARQRQSDHFDRVQWWFQQEQEIPLRFTPFLKVEE